MASTLLRPSIVESPITGGHLGVFRHLSLARGVGLLSEDLRSPILQSGRTKRIGKTTRHRCPKLRRRSRDASHAAACILFALAPVGRALPTPFPRFGAACVRADFASQGEGIRAERCGPSNGRAVIVLHGCGGFSAFDHQLATALPRFGIATLYVDYFALTAPPRGRSFCSVIWKRPARLFAAWQRVAVDAAVVLRHRYAYVGAVGWSLGGSVAIGAAEEAPVFDAVAAFSALAYPRSLAHAAALLPSIFLDGGPGDLIPPAKARALYRAARRSGVPAALYVYPHGTHEWPGRQGEIGRAHAASFLLRYLR